MNAHTALASVAVVAWVLAMSALFDFDSGPARTAFVGGIVVGVVAGLIGGWADDAGRSRG